MLVVEYRELPDINASLQRQAGKDIGSKNSSDSSVVQARALVEGGSLDHKFPLPYIIVKKIPVA